MKEFQNLFIRVWVGRI